MPEICQCHETEHLLPRRAGRDVPKPRLKTMNPAYLLFSFMSSAGELKNGCPCMLRMRCTTRGWRIDVLGLYMGAMRYRTQLSHTHRAYRFTPDHLGRSCALYPSKFRSEDRRFALLAASKARSCVIVSSRSGLDGMSSSVTR
jgi:hypothetical protein